MRNELRGIGLLLFAILLNTVVSPMVFIAVPIGIIGLIFLFKKENSEE